MSEVSDILAADNLLGDCADGLHKYSVVRAHYRWGSPVAWEGPKGTVIVLDPNNGVAPGTVFEGQTGLAISAGAPEGVDTYEWGYVEWGATWTFVQPEHGTVAVISNSLADGTTEVVVWDGNTLTWTALPQKAVDAAVRVVDGKSSTGAGFYEGNSVLVGSNPSGDFAGRAGLAVLTASGWVFYAQPEVRTGCIAYRKDNNTFEVFNASGQWVSAPTVPLPPLATETVDGLMSKTDKAYVNKLPKRYEASFTTTNAQVNTYKMFDLTMPVGKTQTVKCLVQASTSNGTIGYVAEMHATYRRFSANNFWTVGKVAGGSDGVTYIVNKSEDPDSIIRAYLVYSSPAAGNASVTFIGKDNTTVNWKVTAELI